MRILAVVGLVLGLLTACGEESPDALAAAARASLARHDGDAALVQLKQWLDLQPASAEGRYLLGTLLLARGDARSAAIELAKAAEAGHAEVLTAPALARALLGQGEYRKVVQAYASTSLTDPQAIADLATSVATAHFALQHDADGQAALARAQATVPDFAPARLLQARRAAAGGDRAAALALVDQAGRSAPEDPAVWLLRGDLLAAPPVKAADAGPAVAAYRQALALGGDAVQAHTAILNLLIGQKDLAGAQKQFEALRQQRPTHPQTVYFDAVLALQRSDLPAARAAADKLLSSAPNHPPFQRLVGTVALEAGELPKASTQLGAALQATPGDKSLRRLLALALLRQGEPGRALATLQPLLGAQAPDAEAMALAALAYLHLREPLKARPLFAAAARLAPDDARVRTTLAMGRLATGEGDAALADLQRIAATDSGTAADLAVIRAHLQRKRWDAANAAIDALDRKRPGEPAASLLRGELLVRRGDIPAARRQYELAVKMAPRDFPATAALAELDLQQRQPDEARRRFEALLARDPGNSAALVALAALGDMTGADSQQGTRLLTQAVEAQPGQAGPRLLLIDHLLKHRAPQAALTAAREAVVVLPDEPRLQEALARATAATGDYGKAATAYSRLASMQPGSIGPLLSLAQAQMALKDLDGARRSIQQALRAQPDAANALAEAVRLEVAARRPKEALVMARRLQSLRPDDALGALLEGEVQASQQAWTAAEAAYRTALRKRGDAGRAARALHQLLLAEQKPADAERFSAGWLREHPRDLGFLVYLGENAMVRGDLAAAEARFQSALQLRPNHAPVLNNLAWVTHRLGHPGALAFAERACARQPDEPSYLDTLAVLQAESGQREQALATQRKAIALAPEDAQLRLTLARLHAGAGDKSSALAELDRLSALGDGFAGQTQVAALRKSL